MINEIYDRFLGLECRERLMQRTVGGVPYWHLVRFYVYTRSVLPLFVKLDAAHPDFESVASPRRSLLRRVAGKLRRWTMSALAATVRNPRLVFRRRDVLFSLTPRQTDFGDGRKVSVLLDFFVPRIKSSAALLELVLPPGPTRQPRGRRVLWLREGGRWFDECRRSAEYSGTAAERRREAEHVARLLSAEFGATVSAEDVASHIDYALLVREAYLPVCRTLLRRMSPKLVVTAVQYHVPNFVLTEAAHELGIKVAELQHGTVYPAHAAYNLPENGSVYSPDVFLSWGGRWAEQMRNYPRAATILSGYPYIDHCLLRYPPSPRADGKPFHVLFVSQGTVARQLVEIAAGLRALLPRDRFAVVYKLHPNESRTWRTRYPALQSAGVEVVENMSRNIYRCLADADVTVGLNSTALIEGFAWGVRAIVLGWLPGAESMGEFCRLGMAECVDSASHLAERVRSLEESHVSADFDRSRFWVPNAAENVASFIDALAEGKSPPGFARAPRGVESAYADESHETT